MLERSAATDLVWDALPQELTFNVSSPGHGRPDGPMTTNPGNIQRSGQTRSPLVVIG